MHWLIVLILPSTLFVATQASNPYCSRCRDHTMCTYPGVSAKCIGGSKSIPLGTRALIVDTHNRLRNVVASGAERRGYPGPQPSACDMLTLYWDDELARVAQRWADQCTFVHDRCRSTGRFAAVGQNLSQRGASGNASNVDDMWVKSIQGWYDEVSRFPNSLANKYAFSSQTGHYSQMVWGKTRLVGCGFNTYKSGSLVWYIFVCNYGPSGNYMNQPVYKRGNPGGCCQNNTVNTKYRALCK